MGGFPCVWMGGNLSPARGRASFPCPPSSAGERKKIVQGVLEVGLGAVGGVGDASLDPKGFRRKEEIWELFPLCVLLT